ncbi:MAG: shikimate dehydrogenase, partial [Thermoguttaceae bacterium]|nr:shikimate dehydrogenase [Thermoguttaceae bacterium]
DQLETFLKQDAPALNVKGLSVTIPHKVNVIRHLNFADPAVLKIGACNTIVWKDGKRYGYNTDYNAAMDGIASIFGWKEPLPIEISKDGKLDKCKEQPMAGKVALILGAGGVAKAVATGLRLRGADLIITDIDAARAEELAQRLDGKAVPWNKRADVDYDLVVNCTPVGMYPKSNVSPFDPEKMNAYSTSKPLGAFDCVYNPEDTLFLKSARKKNWKTASGLDMFARQAELQYRLFLHQPAPVEVMKDAVRQATAQSRW